MRILIILSQYHPALNPNVYRWSAIAEYWVRDGHDVHVLCTRRQGVSDSAIKNGVWVHRAGQNSLLDWVSNVLRFKMRRGEVGGSNAKPRKIRRFLEAIIDYTWRAVYWPDGTILWYLPGKRKAILLHENHSFDAVISVSLPFTANLIAAALKKRFSGIKWLMDIEDPFAVAAALYINNTFFYNALNFKAEQKLLNQADVISVTVEATRDLYLEVFKSLAHKIHIIPPLYSLLIKNKKLELEKGKIHLGYFGAFYHPIRTPEAFLYLLQQAFQVNLNLKEKIIIHFFGEVPAIIQPIFEKYNALSNNLIFYGLVEREMVAAAIPAMDFLVNIGNTTTYHLPSKAVDYLMSAKPIVNIYYNQTDPFKDFFTPYPIILNLLAQKERFSTLEVQAFIHFINQNKGKLVSQDLVERLGAPYQIEHIADNYLRLLQTGL